MDDERHGVTVQVLDGQSALPGGVPCTTQSPATMKIDRWHVVVE